MGKAPKKKTKPPHEPTEQNRKIVLKHAAIGTPQATIAYVLEIDVKTLCKYYRDELDHGKAQANAKVAAKLYDMALSGVPSAVYFWLKTQAGFKETNSHEHSGPNGGAIPVETTGTVPFVLAGHSEVDGEES